MSGMRSHTQEKLLEAQAAGKTLYALDTGSDGQDDILIAENGEDPAELMGEVAHWFEEPVPAHWTLTKVDWDL